MTGKTDGGKRVGFDFVEGRNIGKGEYAVVEITRATGHTLRGEVRGRSGIKDWEEGRWERFGEVVSPGKVNIEVRGLSEIGSHKAFRQRKPNNIPCGPFLFWLARTLKEKTHES